MSQTSIIAAAIVVAYVIFVTVNNELPCWLEIMGISSGNCCAQTAGGISVGPVTVNPPTIRIG